MAHRFQAEWTRPQKDGTVAGETTEDESRKEKKRTALISTRRVSHAAHRDVKTSDGIESLPRRGG